MNDPTITHGKRVTDLFSPGTNLSEWGRARRVPRMVSAGTVEWEQVVVDGKPIWRGTVTVTWPPRRRRFRAR